MNKYNPQRFLEERIKPNSRKKNIYRMVQEKVSYQKKGQLERRVVLRKGKKQEVDGRKGHRDGVEGRDGFDDLEIRKDARMNKRIGGKAAMGGRTMLRKRNRC